MPETLERLCFNCNSFFPDTFEATEYGICLDEEVFEPFLDKMGKIGRNQTRKSSSYCPCISFCR